ncbi:MAG TPA: alpha/beta hydrolase [Chitinophagaceae bacterium]|jgi:acetyl esterase/lipase|nr:alpha/beta hydrolase [Chitinophagaceae bacterium]
MKIIFSLLLIMSTHAIAQKTIIPLYKNNQVKNAVPCGTKEIIDTSNGRIHISHVIEPSLTVYQPANMNKARSAVIVCPGGSYINLSMTHEGYDVAKELNKYGITAFVLKYRLPNDSCMQQKETGPLQDIQQAIILVKSQAKEWGIDTSKLGVLGFSAGGHLVSTSVTHFTTCYADNPLNISVRPAFGILIYPVISFQQDIAHAGSRNNLLGKNPSQEKLDLYSSEKQITPQTPPCFLVHAEDDRTVPVKNSIRFYEALVNNKVKGEMLIYQNGGHGFGLVNPSTKENWMDNLIRWLQLNGFYQAE